MIVTFWGVRGSIATPGADTIVYGGNTTCLEITLESGQPIIIDAGTGIRCLGDSLMSRNKHNKLLMLLTHIHWDHILGFPFFAPLFQTNCGIVVDGCKRAMEGLRRVFSSNHVDGTWPLRFEDLKARIEAHPEILNNPIKVDDAVIEAHPLHHPQGGVGFKFRENGKTLVFLTDNELINQGWKGASFQHFVRFCSGADVLIHDCQYLHSEIETKRGWGHSDTKSTADLAFEAGVDKLILFHHDPWRKDRQIEVLVAECERFLKEKHSGISVSAAREGSSFNL